MRFLIDGTEWSFPHMESLSREEQLEALREKVSAEGRVIVDMLSDGESLDDGDLLTVPDGPGGWESSSLKRSKIPCSKSSKDCRGFSTAPKRSSFLCWMGSTLRWTGSARCRTASATRIPSTRARFPTPRRCVGAWKLFRILWSTAVLRKLRPGMRMNGSAGFCRPFWTI